MDDRMDSMEKIFDAVAKALPAAGIEFLMIGGHAVNHYGYSRATIDVGFMIASSHVDAVRTAMRSAGFTTISQAENVVFFNHPAIPHRVDFLQVDEDTFHALADRASRVEYGGQSLLIPSLPDLIAMKLFGKFRRNAMLDFPRIGKVTEPPRKKMDSMEYIRFCDFYIKNNPHITAENCLHRKTGEEDIKVPFHF